MSEPLIRKAKPGEESAIHEAHMRSIREVCIKDHGEEEVRGWGNRPLGNRWTQAIKEDHVWVVVLQKKICGQGYLKISETNGEKTARIHGLYLTPEVLHKGVGFKLANLMIEKAKESGATAVTLDSSLTAHAFYKRLGFNDCGPMERTDIGGSFVRGYPMILKLPS
jgi:GNAT superfamily N-acetyltransferase